MIDEEVDEIDELRGIIPDWYIFNFSEKQINKLSKFKNRVDKALKEKDSKLIKILVKERDKIVDDETNKEDNLKKSLSFIINRNPLFLKLKIKEIKELFK